MTNPLHLIHPPSSSPPTTFSSLPNEIVIDCLARIPKSYYRSICLVSKRFNSLLSSQEIYKARSRIGATEPRLYVCLWLPPFPNHRWFTLSDMNGKLSLVPVRLASSCDCTPLYENTVAVGSEIYQIGGTVYQTRSRDIHVLDCWTHTWRVGPKLTGARKLVKSWYLDGKIYTIGTCVDIENPMISGEVLDLKTRIWKSLRFPSGEDNSFRVAVFGGRLYVSYVTSGNKYVYDPKEGNWVKDDESEFLELKPNGVYPPWCLIDKVMFAVTFDDKYEWYNSHCKKWTSICGLDDFYRDRPYKRGYYTVRIANYGGKLVVMWQTEDRLYCSQMKIWCTVISLEERKTPLGLEIWGKVERANYVMTVPESYWVLSCLSVSV